MSMRLGETGKRTAALLVAGALAALLAYAWIDGGREPIRQIEYPLQPPAADGQGPN